MAALGHHRPPVAAFDRLRVVAASIDINRLSLPIKLSKRVGIV